LKKQINIEGYTPEEIVGLPDEQLDAFVLSGASVVFRAGTAEILGEFKVSDRSLLVELAHIDGGGEGALPTLSALARRYAKKRGLKRIEWVVHALNCAKPNPKLRRVMERRGFVVTEVEGIGQAYYLVDDLE
jgi:hypothetical protein